MLYQFLHEFCYQRFWSSCSLTISWMWVNFLPKKVVRSRESDTLNRCQSTIPWFAWKNADSFTLSWQDSRILVVYLQLCILAQGQNLNLQFFNHQHFLSLLVCLSAKIHSKSGLFSWNLLNRRKSDIHNRGWLWRTFSVGHCFSGIFDNSNQPNCALIYINMCYCTIIQIRSFIVDPLYSGRSRNHRACLAVQSTVRDCHCILAHY